MRHVLLVGAGGFFGSILRLGVGALFAFLFGSRFPLGTLFVNLAGCLLIGVLGGWFEKRVLLSPELRALLITGFLGGFTTFSAFGSEAMLLLRQNKLPLALFYVSASVIGGLLMVWLGLKLSGALEPAP